MPFRASLCFWAGLLQSPCSHKREAQMVGRRTILLCAGSPSPPLSTWPQCPYGREPEGSAMRMLSQSSMCYSVSSGLLHGWLLHHTSPQAKVEAKQMMMMIRRKRARVAAMRSNSVPPQSAT
ncbi:hypothetical protein EMPG_12683 [Blastomyces silverae]|uniref:Uncharacterized protein n=1 Tax=Blastomyces silverae TaxID=2060906 RepID=A0A0H1BMF6_9EURO|nr:hypothetical protein EMPG_12683 [Blastomyces silverae]